MSESESLMAYLANKNKKRIISMKSKWKVTSNIIGSERMYAVYRLLDVNAVDHSGNREFAGEYITDREACEAVATALNGKEESAEHFVDVNKMID